jgi:HipA N-terminal domain
MAERNPVDVTVQIDGQDQVAGTLWIHDRGGQTASFRYADSYLSRQGSYALDPALPKAAGVFHTSTGTATFGAFGDSAPDRWGENLMRREERGSGTEPLKPGTSSTRSPTLNANSPAQKATRATPSRTGRCHPAARAYRLSCRLAPVNDASGS